MAALEMGSVHVHRTPAHPKELFGWQGFGSWRAKMVEVEI